MLSNESKNLNAFAEALSSVFESKKDQTKNMRTRILNETINSIDTPHKLNALIDTLAQADLRALLTGDTITVFRKFQLKTVEDYCASIGFPIHVQPCIDKGTNEIWAYNISKYFTPESKITDEYSGSRYHY